MMNKEDFYNRNILEGPLDDPYSYAASLLPPPLRKEYESARSEYSRHLRQLIESIDRTGNKELKQIYMDYEPAVTDYHTITYAAMFLYGAELMEKECAQAVGNWILKIADEKSPLQK